MSDPYENVGAKIGFDDDHPQWRSLLFFTQRIDAKFWCMDGPPVAYFEIPTIFRDPTAGTFQDVDPVRIVYQTIELAMPGTPTEDRVSLLCVRAWDDYFTPILDMMPDSDFCRTQRLLFWRKRPMIGHNDGNTKLRMRLTVPGFMFEKLVKPAMSIVDANGNESSISAVELFPSPYEKRA